MRKRYDFSNARRGYAAQVKELQVAIRMEAETLARAMKLIPALQAAHDFRGFRITRATVLRMAILRGLDFLEAEYAPEERRR